MGYLVIFLVLLIFMIVGEVILESRAEDRVRYRAGEFSLFISIKISSSWFGIEFVYHIR